MTVPLRILPPRLLLDVALVVQSAQCCSKIHAPKTGQKTRSANAREPRHEGSGLRHPRPAPDAPITKAVIAAAGSGTRFLPATKAIPKEMIPLIDRPIVQYVVEELAESGIEDVVFVSRWDKKVLEDHFDQHPTLEDSLAATGRQRYLEATRRPGELANVAYIRQRGPYGNGTPALNAGHLVGDAPFVYAFGDDLVSSGVPFTRQLIDQYRKTPGVILGAQEVHRDEVPNYGMIETNQDLRVTRIVEKPTPAEVTSTLVGFGRYILPPEVVDILRETRPGKDDELWLMDAVDSYMRQGGHVYACPVSGGRWLTTGDPVNYLEALFHYALRRDDLKDHVARIVRRVAAELGEDRTNNTA